jgi:hypothetical protein
MVEETNWVLFGLIAIVFHALWMRYLYKKIDRQDSEGFRLLWQEIKKLKKELKKLKNS